MASLRSLLQLLKKPHCHLLPVTSLFAPLEYANGAQSAARKSVRGLALLGAGVSGILSLGTVTYAEEPDIGLSCPSYPWPYKGVLSSNDRASVQRDQLFRSDCASCHGGLLTSHRRTGGAAYPVKEMGDTVAEIDVIHTPDNEREVLTCPRQSVTYFPRECSVEQVARFGNGRGYPSDLNLITKIQESLRYNPYFSSGVMAKQKMASFGTMDLDYGIPRANIQIEKDVAAFSSWVTQRAME